MKKKAENHIVTEDDLWDYTYYIISALLVLQKLNLRHGHIRYYSIRNIDYQPKLLYYPSQKSCFDIIMNNKEGSDYFHYFLSP
jgi:hypothetical protein